MLVGVPKEIKANENRVGLTPTSVAEFVKSGHKVIVETNAGQGIGSSDQDYKNAGAQIIETAKEIFATADMIVKVKEPQEVEYKQLRKDQILYTYLHLSPDAKQTQGLIDSGCIAIAYETVTDNNGGLPLLAPMSEVAGKMASQVGAYFLQKADGGSGVLFGGVAGVAPASVAVIGGGVAGLNAIKMAVGMGANVTVLDRNIDRLRYIDDIYHGSVTTLYSTSQSIEETVINADLVVGTVLIPGANAPKLITKDIISKMKKDSVVVDVAIDQGGCTDVSKATTHEEPVFKYDNVNFYCVANMPGGVPKTSTYALNNATLSFGLQIANKGAEKAMLENKHLLNGLNIYKGSVTYKAVSDAQGIEYTDPKQAIS